MGLVYPDRLFSFDGNPPVPNAYMYRERRAAPEPGVNSGKEGTQYAKKNAFVQTLPLRQGTVLPAASADTGGRHGACLLQRHLGSR